ncbi:MAG TPA: chloride channel protein [Solirubrobacteraceae bacterium]|nr:chloride channel protein [Solirubrobacteraceae bacterium]
MTERPPPAPANDHPQELTSEQADATIRSKRYAVLLVVVAVIGVIVSLAAWCFLEAIHQIQQELYTHLPHAFGYSGAPPKWWPLPILAVGALITAIAIRYLPGEGGHVPAKGLAVGGGAGPKVLPGVLLAGLGTIGFGLVLGPEAPLIALGAGVATLTILAARRDSPQQMLMVVGAAGSFAAVSFIFASPLIAAVILIEAAGLGGPRLRVVLVPGLLAAGIGTLVSIGMGSFTGLSSSAYALGALSLTPAAHPHLGEFAWTIALAGAIGVVTSFAIRGGLLTHSFVSRRQLLALLPVVGLITGGLAIAFSQITGKGFSEVLFSGQDQLPGLVSQAGTWSVAALAWLVVFKGIAYSVSLGSLRGGPTFPALFLGAAAGIMASHLPGFPIQAGVAVGMGAATVAVLRLPLSAVVIATLLTTHATSNVEPLIIVGVVVAYIVTLLLARSPAPASDTAPVPPPAPTPQLAAGMTRR